MSEAVRLLAQAEQCFRLSAGQVRRLAEELETFGRALQREAAQLEIKDGNCARAPVAEAA